MIRKICLASIFVATIAAPVASAQSQRLARLDANGNLDSMIARQAAANNVPEALVRRVIKRESGGNPRAVSKGNFGLMQIKLATARSMGYTGNAAGLLDPETNMTYAVKYLAGAYHAADGNPNRAVHYYAAGYYYAAKRKGSSPTVADNPLNAFASAPGSAPAVASTATNPAEKMRAARAAGDSVSSSSSLYTGQLDYH